MTRQPFWEKENFEFNLGVLSFKIDLVSHSIRGAWIE